MSETEPDTEGAATGGGGLEDIIRDVLGGKGGGGAKDILDKVNVHGWESMGATADIIGIVMFAGLCALLLRAAQKKLA